MLPHDVAARRSFVTSGGLQKILELQPEQGEADGGNWWRVLYKLGKALVGLTGPLKVVGQVKEQLEGFRSHLPTLGALLNPGMRERHWKKVVETLRGTRYERYLED